MSSIHDSLVINATMGADITSAAPIYKKGKNFIGAKVSTAQGTASPDHVGVLKWKAGTTQDVNEAVVLPIPQTSIPSGSEFDDIVEFECNLPYLWAFYDRTSGGDDDTLRVEVSLSEE